MRELLLINNEPTPEDRGRIARAGELGLTDPLYNIDREGELKLLLMQLAQRA